MSETGGDGGRDDATFARDEEKAVATEGGEGHWLGAEAHPALSGVGSELDVGHAGGRDTDAAALAVG